MRGGHAEFDAEIEVEVAIVKSVHSCTGGVHDLASRSGAISLGVRISLQV